MKPLVVSIGCPQGIGPEVAVAAAAESDHPVLLVGDGSVIARAAELTDVARQRIVPIATAAELPLRMRPNALYWWKPSTPLTQDPGAAQLAWIDAACDLVAAGAGSALVTGPASKARVVESGRRTRDANALAFAGHTEHLMRRLRAKEVVMAFADPKLVTALVTTHLPLRDVPDAITQGAVAAGAYWLARLLVATKGRQQGVVRLAVAALNPHAGEGGLLGNEEATVIAPGITFAKRRIAKHFGRGIEQPVKIVGPMGAETAYRRAAAGHFDGVLGMYHDQATIASKLTGFGEAVNISLGLPIVRTSVDHGTADALAWMGRASADGMRAALAYGARLAKTDLCNG